MPKPCLQHCTMTKCRQFFQCPEHWDPEELAEMQHITPAEEAAFDQPPEKESDQ